VHLRSSRHRYEHYLKFILFVLPLMLNIVLAAAQNSNLVTIQSLEGTLELALPAGWHIIEQSTPDEALALALRSSGESHADVFIWNILPNCGLAVQSIWVSCDMRPVELVSYVMSQVVRFGSYGTEDFATVNEVGYMLHPSYITGMKDLSNGNFLVVFTQIDEEDFDTVYADMQAIFQSAALDITFDQSYPQPEYTETSWTLDLSSFGIQPEAVQGPMIGADGHIYLRVRSTWDPPSGLVVVVNMDGTIHNVVSNPYLGDVRGGLRDWAATADGTIWVLSGELNLYRINRQGIFEGQVFTSRRGQQTVTQIELVEHNLALLRKLYERAVIAFINSDGVLLREFPVHAEDFPYSSFGPWLSSPSLGVSPNGLIYVYNEMVNQVRVFDATGQIVHSALLSEPMTVTGFGFGADGSVDIYISTYAHEKSAWEVLRYRGSEVVERLPLPNPNAIYLPGTDQLIMLDGNRLVSLIEGIDTDE
jgi:hypothetical protein